MGILDRVRSRNRRKPGRRQPGAHIRRAPRDLFVNPYPWMSAPEAMVRLELERRGVPFSWRYFDGDNAPNFLELLVKDGFHPEFTLREHKAVIMVQGEFFGTLPGVLDKVALAQVALEEDGWVAVILFERDIRAGKTWQMLSEKIPGLGSIQGPSRPNPYGGDGPPPLPPGKPERVTVPDFFADIANDDFDVDAAVRNEDAFRARLQSEGYILDQATGQYVHRSVYDRQRFGQGGSEPPKPGSPLDLMSRRREQLRGQSLQRAYFKIGGGTRGVRNRGRRSRKPRNRRLYDGAVSRRRQG